MPGFGDNFEYRGKLKKIFKNNLVSIMIYFLLSVPFISKYIKQKGYYILVTSFDIHVFQSTF